MYEIEKDHIIIVDDSPEYLTVLKTHLTSPNLTVVTALSGKEALNLTLEYDFAVIIMDVVMSEMDGIETAERIRGDAETAHIPIIFVTGIDKNRTQVFKGYDAGAVEYLFKPLNYNILKSKINFFLDLHRRKKALEKANRKLVENNELIILQKEQLLITLSKLKTAYEKLKNEQNLILELERKNAIMAMAVTANHELKQPLTVLGGYLELLQMSLESEAGSDKQIKSIKKIRDSYEWIKDTLDKLNESTVTAFKDDSGESS